MKPINKKIQIGTKVKLMGTDGWHTVKEIYGGPHERNWIKVDKLVSSFQSGHITKFTNRK